MYMKKCITKKIRELRIENKLTIQELANKLNIPPSSLGMYERGMRNPDLELVMKISSIFNVDAKYFYDENNTISELINNINKIEEKSELIEAKKRAGEFCELCNGLTPFFLENGDPYLEDLEINIKDNVTKIAMLCPNCKKKVEILKYAGDINYLKRKIERELNNA